MEKLLNFFQSSGNIATSGQPSAEEFASIALNGYSAVINLAMHDSDKALKNEDYIVASLGLSYFHIPVPFEKPSRHHLKLFFGLMDCLEGEKV